jgi:hypothetical protein
MDSKCDSRQCYKTPPYQEHQHVVLDSPMGIVDRDQHREVVSKSSLHDQASLLLSIANIAHSEILKCPSALTCDDSRRSRHSLLPSSFPAFPKHLEEDDFGRVPNHMLVLLPRTESLRHAIGMGLKGSNRLRSVSFDSPTSSSAKNVKDNCSSSPLLPPPFLHPCVSDVVGSIVKRSSKNGLTSSKKSMKMTSKIYSNRLSRSKKVRLESHTKNTKTNKVASSAAVVSPRSSLSTKSSTTSFIDHPIIHAKSSIQGIPSGSVTIKKIFRRKFSWKNYPEVRFL